MSKFYGKTFNPTDDESATKILNMFNDMAYSVSYKDIFTKAAGILHGPSFIVKTDSSNRMYFRCMICNKDMNNIRSLTDHALSGSHLKNVDSGTQDSVDTLDLSKLNIDYELNALQEKVIKSSVPIVGLNRAEAYNDGGRNWYYKCTLCGAHGNADSLYNHLIGDKHTDRYIKSRLELKSSTINQEERNYLRTVLVTKESFSAHNIRTIYGREFYPYIWESDGKLGYSSKSKKKIYDLNDDIPFPKEVSENWNDNPSALYNEACAVVNHESKPVPVECCSNQYYNILIMKLKSLYFDLSRKENEFKNSEDVRIGLIMLSFLLHWNFYVYNSITSDGSMTNNHAVEQRKITMGCLGHVENKLKPILRAKYSTEADI